MAEVEEDFFSMLNKFTSTRLDEQRSSAPVHDAPLMINFDLVQNELTGGALVTSKEKEFPCNYLGHVQTHIEKDKEALCNRHVWKFCKGKATTKAKNNAEPYKNIVKVDALGVEFTIGANGAAKVLIPLQQVACVSLCAKKEGGPLKVVAILCRSALHRIGQKGVGELEMMIHMCRLKDKQTMWAFQKAFVTALRTAFPKEHKNVAEKKKEPAPIAPLIPEAEFTPKHEPRIEFDSTPAQPDIGHIPDGPDGGYLDIGKEKPFDPRDMLLEEKVKEPEPPQPDKKKSKAFVHKVYVKSRDQTVDEDTALARKLQRREEMALAAIAKQEEDDAALVRSLQIEEDAHFARAAANSNDDEPKTDAIDFNSDDDALDLP